MSSQREASVGQQAEWSVLVDRIVDNAVKFRLKFIKVEEYSLNYKRLIGELSVLISDQARERAIEEIKQLRETAMAHITDDKYSGLEASGMIKITNLIGDRLADLERSSDE